MSRRSYTRLPSGYQELDSISSTGKAAFKVAYNVNNVVPGFDFVWKFDSTVTSLNEELNQFGDYASSGNTYWLFYKRPANHSSTPNKLMFKYNAQSVGYELEPNYNYTAADFQRCSLINGTFTKCDGTTQTGLNRPKTGSYYGYVGVGTYWNGQNSSFQVRNNTSVKQWFRYLAFYNGTTKVIELIPCKRYSDGKIGMYDLINNVFHSSETSTEFGAGSVVQ